MNQHLSRLGTVRPTLPTSLPAAAILVGDGLAILAFIATGLHSHGIYAWEFPMHTARTATPFLAVWWLSALLFGLYHEQTVRSYRRTVAFVVATWLVVTALGTQLRATSYFPGDAPPTFVLVTLFFGMAFVLSWRLATVWLCRRYGGRLESQ